MLDFLDFDSLTKNPGSWVMIFLLILVIWLLKIVSDLRTEVTLVRQANAHHLTSSFLVQHTNNNNRDLLQRITDSVKRACKKSLPQTDPCVWKQFEAELAAEMKSLEGTLGAQAVEAANAAASKAALNNGDDDDDDEDTDEEEDAGETGTDDGKGNDFGELGAVGAKPVPSVAVSGSTTARSQFNYSVRA